MQPTPCRDEEYVMPAAEAVLAGTLALMTGYAQCDCMQRRTQMAAQVQDNLQILSRHPGLTDSFHVVAERLRQHWNLARGLADVLPEARLWHRAPEMAQ